MKDSLPPLLRGIGTLFILIAAIIAFVIARRHDQSNSTGAPPNQIATRKKNADSQASAVTESHDRPEEAAQDSAVEEVLENIWVDCLGFAGPAIFSISFFVEAYHRHDKNR
jgi:hypothetical protein